MVFTSWQGTSAVTQKVQNVTEICAIAVNEGTVHVVVIHCYLGQHAVRVLCQGRLAGVESSAADIQRELVPHCEFCSWSIQL